MLLINIRTDEPDDIQERTMMLNLLETALNRALQLDELMPEKLRALKGGLLKIVLQPFNIGFYMQFGEDKITLLSETSSTPDTVIYSHPIHLLRLGMLPGSGARSLFHRDVRMVGDAVFGQAVKQLFDGIDIDWEGHLATFIGDMPAYQMGQAARGVKRFTSKVLESWQRNISDYVHEEGRLSPSQAELRDFCDEVDQLVLDVERFEARMERGL